VRGGGGVAGLRGVARGVLGVGLLGAAVRGEGPAGGFVVVGVFLGCVGGVIGAVAGAAGEVVAARGGKGAGWGDLD